MVAPERAGSPELDTIPKLLLHSAACRPHRPAMRHKKFGIWNSWTWEQVLAEVRQLASGFAAMGLDRGERLAVIGGNRPRLYWSMTAAQCLGAIPVPMYPGSTAAEIELLVRDAEPRFAIAEDQEQVDKLLEIRERCGKPDHIFFDAPRGLGAYRDQGLLGLAQLEAAGSRHDAANPALFRQAIAAGRGSDLATIHETAGTTGRPKLVALSHDNLIRAAESAIEFDGLNDREEAFVCVPMAWIGDYAFSVAQAYCAGFCVSCPESPTTLLADLREIGPTCFFAPPRVWQNILSGVMTRMGDASGLKRRLFAACLATARRVAASRLEGKPVGFADRLRCALADVVILGPLRNVLGMSRARLAYGVGEAIGPDVFLFYRSLGINIKQLYGCTESAAFITIQPDDEVRADTVGRPLAGVELRIAASGEVHVRGPGVFVEYHRDPEATAAAKTADGFLATGDTGYVDTSGHLRIVDRAEDIGRLADGARFAPKFVENKLNYLPHIKEAVVFGDRRDYATALIVIDANTVGGWAKRRGLAFTSFGELAGKPEVAELIAAEIAQVNRDLVADQLLAGSQIRRFVLLRKEFDADDGELTRTGKLRRHVVAQKYKVLVDALYSEQETCAIETGLGFDDGSAGTVRTAMRIAEAACLPAGVPARVAGSARAMAG